MLSLVLAQIFMGEVLISWSELPNEARFFFKYSDLGYCLFWPVLTHWLLRFTGHGLTGLARTVLALNYLIAVMGLVFQDSGIPENLLRFGYSWVGTFSIINPLVLVFDFGRLVFQLGALFILFLLPQHYFKSYEKDFSTQQFKILRLIGILSLIPGALLLKALINAGYPAMTVGHLFLGFWIIGLVLLAIRYGFVTAEIDADGKEIFRQINEVAILTDMNFRIREINQGFTSALGFDPWEVIDHSLFELVQRADGQKFNPSNNGQPWEGIEFKLKKKYRGALIFKVKRSLISRKTKDVAQLFILSDITDLKNHTYDLESNLNLRTKELQIAKDEAERRLRITEIYTKPSIVKFIGQGGDPTSQQPQLKQVSILFSDIRNFTGLTESLGPLETVIFLNTYFYQMNGPVLKNKGEIDKLMGDCLMAIFSDPDSALNAAIEMRLNLREFNLYRQSVLRVENGIGIGFGNVVVGNIGSPGKMDFTVIGDIVNSASRIENLTKDYGLPLLISGDFRNQLKNEYKIRFIDQVVVKGKKNSLDIFEVFDFEPPEIQRLKIEYQGELEFLFLEYQAENYEFSLDGYLRLRDRIGPHKHRPGICKDPLIDFFIRSCREKISK